MHKKIYLPLISFIIACSLEGSQAKTIHEFGFSAPVDLAALESMYANQSDFRGGFNKPIPSTRKELLKDLKHKAKARLLALKNKYVQNKLAKVFQKIYKTLPKGDSPDKKRVPKYKKTDRTVLAQALSAAAAIAQLTSDEKPNREEEISIQVVSLRMKLNKNPDMLNPVPHPIDQLLKQQNENIALSQAQAQNKEEQENIPPASSSASAAAAAPVSASSSPSASASSSAPAQTEQKKGVKRKLVLTEAWQEEQRIKTNNNLAKPTGITEKHMKKLRREKTKKWNKAGKGSQNLEAFFE